MTVLYFLMLVSSYSMFYRLNCTTFISIGSFLVKRRLMGRECYIISRGKGLQNCYISLTFFLGGGRQGAKKQHFSVI